MSAINNGKDFDLLENDKISAVKKIEYAINPNMPLPAQIPTSVLSVGIRKKVFPKKYS